MNFIPNILKHSTEEEFKTRRLKAMQDIVYTFGVPLSHTTACDLVKTKVDFTDEKWLVEQLERIPKIVYEMDTKIEDLKRENQRLKEELEGDRDE